MPTAEDVAAVRAQAGEAGDAQESGGGEGLAGLRPSDFGTSAAPKGDAEGATDAAEAPAAEPWRRCAEWRLPCYIRGSAAPGGGADALHLCVDTCTTRPRADLAGLPFDWAKGRFVHDFGALSTGACTTVAVAVRNALPETPLELAVEPLDPLGAFEVVNAPRTVPPGGAFAVKLRFRPPAAGPFWEAASLRVPGQTLRLEMSGTGVAPRVELDPPGAPAAIDLGDVVVGEAAEAPLTLRNPSPFPLTVTVRPRGLGHRNVGAVAALFASPETATIDAGSTAAFRVCFQPDCQVRCCHSSALRRLLPSSELFQALHVPWLHTGTWPCQCVAVSVCTAAPCSAVRLL